PRHRRHAVEAGQALPAAPRGHRPGRDEVHAGQLRARRHARAEIEPLVADVKKLHKELTDRKVVQDTEAFYADLRRYANEEGAELLEGEADEIVKFMADNQYGPKAAKAAVVAWLETKAPAAPTFEPAKAFTFADDEHA